MIINTMHDIGDYIPFEGKIYKIISVHVYRSENVLTERYYLGNETWCTIKIESHKK